MALKKGQIVTVKINYPRNTKLNGIYEGEIVQIGCYRSGFAYFRLDTTSFALPNSSKYCEILYKE